jgi:hypothetical protein
VRLDVQLGGDDVGGISSTSIEFSVWPCCVEPPPLPPRFPNIPFKILEMFTSLAEVDVEEEDEDEDVAVWVVSSSGIIMPLTSTTCGCGRDPDPRCCPAWWNVGPKWNEPHGRSESGWITEPSWWWWWWWVWGRYVCGVVDDVDVDVPLVVLDAAAACAAWCAAWCAARWWWWWWWCGNGCEELLDDDNDVIEVEVLEVAWLDADDTVVVEDEELEDWDEDWGLLDWACERTAGMFCIKFCMMFCNPKFIWSLPPLALSEELPPMDTVCCPMLIWNVFWPPPTLISDDWKGPLELNDKPCRLGPNEPLLYSDWKILSGVGADEVGVLDVVVLGAVDKLGEVVADEGTVAVPLFALFRTKFEKVPAGMWTTVEMAATATGVLCAPVFIGIRGVAWEVLVDVLDVLDDWDVDVDDDMWTWGIGGGNLTGDIWG